ncbi:LysR family transcriptional regulator [Roseibium sp. M-1]
MDTRFLESLLAVAETGSIAAAARQQGLTAAAVSQRIRVLEAEFGAQLLRRTAHAAQPTDACLRLLPAARQLVRDAGKLAGRIEPDGLGGPFRLGAVSTALTDFVPAVVRAFREKAPRATLTIRPGTSSGLYEELLAGTVDAALTVEPPFEPPKEIASRPLSGQPVRHALPAGTRMEAPELPWIVYDRQSWGGRRIWERYGAMISQGHILCELDAVETIAMMVGEGLGQAILPVWSGLADQRPAPNLLPLSQNLVRRMVCLQKQPSAQPSLSELLQKALQPQVDFDLSKAR